MASDESFLDDIIQREGGFVDHPDDRGGPTMWGITQQTLANYRRRPVSPDEVRHLSINEAKAIYRQTYLIESGVAQIDDEQLRALVLDSVVNHGKIGGIRMLQAALGVKEDGVFGPLTKDAVNAANGKQLWVKMMGERILAYGRIITANPSQSKFAQGWMSRMKGLLDGFVV